MSQALRDEDEEFDLFSRLEARDGEITPHWTVKTWPDEDVGSGSTLDEAIEDLRQHQHQSDVEAEPELLPDETREETQLLLLDVDEPWRKLWKGMPEYSQRDLQPFRSVIVHFASLSDMLAFSELTGKKLTLQTKSTWFPPIENQCFQNLRWGDEDQS